MATLLKLDFLKFARRTAECNRSVPPASASAGPTCRAHLCVGKQTSNHTRSIAAARLDVHRITGNRRARPGGRVARRRAPRAPAPTSPNCPPWERRKPSHWLPTQRRSGQSSVCSIGSGRRFLRTKIPTARSTPTGPPSRRPTRSSRADGSSSSRDSRTTASRPPRPMHNLYDFPELAMRYGLIDRVEFRIFWLGPTYAQGQPVHASRGRINGGLERHGSRLQMAVTCRATRRGNGCRRRP